ncbi:hypothetical protein EDEG_02087 [Edhazardia aedis USNM 41457]|uniref:Uncharacterized protein n=1 Tax=Edhazardia aedis (strain USNM 41457) TaxID=1003232 RepID=J9DLW8_EDHAE|nr:hypothetical protein EDEG_02087 [Edhazardia aedis USNM 41457]|eukprot:EJW03575.1 hypothetical protein EDEG_02087 [Edhazardia aedis USNM 41457]
MILNIFLHLINIYANSMFKRENHDKTKEEQTSLEDILKKYPSFMLGKAGCHDCVVAFQALSSNLNAFMYFPKEVYARLNDEIFRTKVPHQITNYPQIFLNGEYIGDDKALAKMVEKMNGYVHDTKPNTKSNNPAK